jgi:hypothetical protein
MHRLKGTAPKSPPDESSHGELYMKLAGTKRLRKVRTTVYVDPGNPFAIESPTSAAPADRRDSHFVSAASEVSTGHHPYRAFDARSVHLCPYISMQDDYFESGDFTRGCTASRSRASQSSRQSIPFIYAPVPRRRLRKSYTAIGGLCQSTRLFKPLGHTKTKPTTT